MACLSRVYPRVGGGTRSRVDSGIGFGGLSPRGRGNHMHIRKRLQGEGSIPAWAGEPHAYSQTVAG